MASDDDLLKYDRIYRYTVPVDDEWHGFSLHGDPLHVASRTVDVVEFWARFRSSFELLPDTRWFRVVGTGHDIPADARYWGATLVGQFVWHLIEMTA